MTRWARLRAPGNAMSAEAGRIGDAINSGNVYGAFERIGRDVTTTALVAAPVVGPASRTAGAMGEFGRTGIRLAAEDFAASRTGQLAYDRLNQFNYKMGMVNYVVPPTQKVLSWADEIPEASPYVTRYDPRFPGRADPAYTIDTSQFSSGKTTSGAGGGRRNSSQFWKAWEKQVPESLSPANAMRAMDGLAPKIDSVWVKTFPEHAAFSGYPLIHHHVNFGAYAMPVPASTHTSSSGIWHLQGIKEQLP